MAGGATFRTVVFDCDSTLSTIEGIEELARDHRAEVESLTEEAMRGAIRLEQVYARRLELVRPPRGRVLALGKRYIDTLVPDAKATIAALQAEDIAVRIISGGLRPAVLALAAELGVADSAVDAVAVYFGDDGSYTGFDETSPLTRSGGKRTVIESWGSDVARPLMLVGDGATDQETAPVVDAFVAFVGVTFRATVAKAASFVIRERTLAPVVPLALGGKPPHSAAARDVFERGCAVLGIKP
jgi:phosphoserine phosphatase